MQDEFKPNPLVFATGWLKKNKELAINQNSCWTRTWGRIYIGIVTEKQNAPSGLESMQCLKNSLCPKTCLDTRRVMAQRVLLPWNHMAPSSTCVITIFLNCKKLCWRLSNSLSFHMWPSPRVKPQRFLLLIFIKPISWHTHQKATADTLHSRREMKRVGDRRG